MFNKRRSQLDEWQEQKIFKIEHNCYYLAFWGLLVAIIVQGFLPGFDFKSVVGEAIILLVMEAYYTIDRLRNGIGDRWFKNDLRTILLSSLGVGCFFGLLLFFTRLQQQWSVRESAVSGLMLGAFMLVVSIIVLSLSSYVVKKKRQHLDAEPDDEGK